MIWFCPVLDTELSSKPKYLTATAAFTFTKKSFPALGGAFLTIDLIPLICLADPIGLLMHSVFILDFITFSMGFLISSQQAGKGPGDPPPKLADCILGTSLRSKMMSVGCQHHRSTHEPCSEHELTSVREKRGEPTPDACVTNNWRCIWMNPINNWHACFETRRGSRNRISTCA